MHGTGAGAGAGAAGGAAAAGDGCATVVGAAALASGWVAAVAAVPPLLVDTVEGIADRLAGANAGGCRLAGGMASCSPAGAITLTVEGRSCRSHATSFPLNSSSNVAHAPVDC